MGYETSQDCEAEWVLRQDRSRSQEGLAKHDESESHYDK